MRARGKEGSGPAPPPRDSELHSQGAQGPEKINAEEQKRGLDLRRREKARAEEEAEALERLQAVASAGDGQDEASADGDADKTPPASRAGRSPSSGETDDQAAIRALLAGEGMSSSSAAREDLTIGLPSEDDLLRADVDTRPEAPSLADYAATPVEHFGAALLRGMGWREGMGAGRKRNGPQSAPEPKKRAELLGLGAKERLVENGGQQTKGKGKKGFKVERPERRYVPVIKKDNGREESGRSGSSVSVSSIIGARVRWILRND